MSSAAKFQALAASSKSADRLRNQSMFSHEFSKVLAARAVTRFVWMLRVTDYDISDYT